MTDNKKKKKTYTRPEGWEKTILSKHFDDDETYYGQKYEDIEKVKEEDERKTKAKKAKEGRFGELISRFFDN